MGVRRILLITEQQGELPPSGDGDDNAYVLADTQELARVLQARPPRGKRAFAAALLDDQIEGAPQLLERFIASGFPAPLVVLVSPGKGDQARRSLGAGAAACVVRAADYREQLRLTLDTAIAHHALKQQSRRMQELIADREAAARKTMREMPEHLHVALHNLHEGVLIVDARSETILAANPAAERLFGAMFVGGGSLGKRPTYRLLDRAGRVLAPHETPIGQVIATGQARIGDQLVIERPDGLRITAATSAVPVHDRAGRLREVVSIYSELTDRVHAQLVRDEILSIASHELRTPLTVVLGYSSLLRTMPVAQGDPRASRALAKIYEQSLRMRDLVEHLLDFSRIALGRLQLQWHEFDLAALVREVGQQQAEAQPRLLRLALPEGPLAMTGDYGRLAQALQQVIRAAWQQHEQRDLLIAIHTGTTASFRRIGMALPRESERRYALIQVGRAGTELAPGPGTALSAVDSLLVPEKALELAISAELVRLHGGALLVEPQPSSGNAFNLLLPLQEQPPALSGSRVSRPRGAEPGGLRLGFAGEADFGARAVVEGAAGDVIDEVAAAAVVALDRVALRAGVGHRAHRPGG